VFGAFVTLLREGFEATLLVAIVLAYLVKIGRKEDFRKVWYGVGAAVAVSVAVAGALFVTAGELEGTAEYVFEGTAMWLAVGFLTYMVLWMRRESRTVAQGIRRGVDSAVEQGGRLALISLVFVMVVREGIETGLFIFGITQTSTPLQVALGAALGIAEFQEAGILPELLPLWNVSGAPIVGEKLLVSELLTALFGWDPEANLLEFVVWVVYIVSVGYAFLRPHPLPEGVAASPATRNN
jgi:high-affinity iron transporter